MFKLALTGGIACGKSLTGKIMAQSGIPVCEADQIGHSVLKEDESVRNAVVREFGATVLAPDGTIDRATLGRMVFADPSRLARLNALTHPAIMRRINDWVQTQTADCVAVIIPLLYEIGAEKGWDGVVCVAAPEADQLRRLTERGLSPVEAKARIDAQLSLAMKMEQADYVIYNGGSQTVLEEQVKQVLRSIRGD